MYIQHKSKFDIQYTTCSFQLEGFTEFDWVGLVDDWKSTLGFVYLPHVVFIISNQQLFSFVSFWNVCWLCSLILHVLLNIFICLRMVVFKGHYNGGIF